MNIRNGLTGLLWLLAAGPLAACTPNTAPPDGTSATSGLPWAYPSGPTTNFAPPSGAGPFSVAGSQLSFTRAELASDTRIVDWYPDEHPAPPAIVSIDPDGRHLPCAACHMYNGLGYPASAELAGLPADFIISQVAAFRSGARTSARVGQPNTAEMIKVAKAITDDELQQAAAYYASLPRRQHASVVEADVVPKTIPDKFGWLDPDPAGGAEPIGERIVELSSDPSAMLLSDNHLKVTDYVPRGALLRGRRVAEVDSDLRRACIACHGAKLEGAGTAPPLSGRSAANLARAIWDIRTGARHEPGSELMQPIARSLKPAEIVDVTAFIASLTP